MRSIDVYIILEHLLLTAMVTAMGQCLVVNASRLNRGKRPHLSLYEGQSVSQRLHFSSYCYFSYHFFARIKETNKRLHLKYDVYTNFHDDFSYNRNLSHSLYLYLLHSGFPFHSTCCKSMIRTTSFS